MGFERRKGSSNGYMYRAARRDGQVKRRYIGSQSDVAVQFLARVHGLSRAEVQALRQASRKERDDYDEVERLIVQLEATFKCLDRGSRLSSGAARRHRKSRGRDRMMRAYDTARVHELPCVEHFNQVVYRADQGDDGALRELRAMLNQYPLLWKDASDLAAIIEQRLIELYATGSVFAQEALRCKVIAMRSELEGPSPSLLKRLIVERVVTSWLDLQLVQVKASEPRSSKTDETHWQKKLDRAQNRYLKAIEQLGEMRGATASGHSAPESE